MRPQKLGAFVGASMGAATAMGAAGTALTGATVLGNKATTAGCSAGGFFCGSAGSTATGATGI